MKIDFPELNYILGHKSIFERKYDNFLKQINEGKKHKDLFFNIKSVKKEYEKYDEAEIINSLSHTFETIDFIMDDLKYLTSELKSELKIFDKQHLQEHYSEYVLMKFNEIQEIISEASNISIEINFLKEKYRILLHFLRLEKSFSKTKK